MRMWRFGCALAAVSAAFGASAAGALAVPSWTMYVGDSGSSPASILPISTATNVPGTPIPETGLSPRGIAITPDGKTAYVANVSPSTPQVVPINLSTNTEGNPITVPAGAFSVAITPDGKTVYVVSQSSGKVTPINTATNAAGTPIPIAGLPIGIAIAPNGRTAYVPTFSGNAVVPINTATNTAGMPITVGHGPTAIAITPDGKTLYVANQTDGTVTPINTATNTAGMPIKVGTNPESIAITPDGKTAYVVNFTTDNVTPINTATNTAGMPVTVGTGPAQIAITPDGKTAYVTNNASGQDSITPINTATNTAGTTFPAGSRPNPLAIAPQQAPHAAFTASTTFSRATFNGSGSSASHGASVARYDWAFGDGSTGSNAGPKPSHTYRKAGTYTISLTVTDSAGCSSTFVFTGQTASCSENSVATTFRQITIAPGVKIQTAKISSKRRTAKFTFRATGGRASGFQCALVKQPAGKHAKAPTPRFRACRSPRTYTHLKRGRYKFYVRAVSRGAIGPAASKSFKIG